MSALAEEINFLREMVAEDIEAVMVGELASYPFPWTQKNFEDCLENHVYGCWVLDDHSGGLYGHLIMSTFAKEAHILNLCIYPHEQGKGWGQKLLNESEQIAIRNEAETSFLEVRPSNQVGVSLYQNAGYNEIGIRKDYYPTETGREDAIVMAKQLVPQSLY